VRGAAIVPNPEPSARRWAATYSTSVPGVAPQHSIVPSWRARHVSGSSPSFKIATTSEKGVGGVGWLWSAPPNHSYLDSSRLSRRSSLYFTWFPFFSSRLASDVGVMARGLTAHVSPASSGSLLRAPGHDGKPRAGSQSLHGTSGGSEWLPASPCAGQTWSAITSIVSVTAVVGGSSSLLGVASAQRAWCW
jgi:hypothetical protein